MPKRKNWWEGASEADAWKLQYAIESAWSDEDPFATKLNLEPALLQVLRQTCSIVGRPFLLASGLGMIVVVELAAHSPKRL